MGATRAPRGRNEALLGRPGDVRVGPDQFGPFMDQLNRAFQSLIAVGAGLAYDHVIRVAVVHGEAGVIEGICQARLADDIGAASLALPGKELGRGQSARVEVHLVHIHTQAKQFFAQLPGRAFAAVGQKQEQFLFPLEPVDEFRCPGKQPVAVIEDAVHVADEGLFPAKFVHGSLPQFL